MNHAALPARLGEELGCTLDQAYAGIGDDQLDVDAAAKKLLASEGYDPQFGARPLKRAIQEHLLDPLATKLLAGDFKPNDKIKVSANNGELAFAKKESK